MAFIPAPSICQAELIYAFDTQVCEIVLHFEPTTALTPTKMTELGAYLVAWWNTNLKTLTPPQASLTAIKLTDLTTNIAPVVNYGVGLPIVGTNASPSLPNNCAMVITKRTLLRGRSYRGRIYHIGLNEAAVTTNTVLSTYVTSCLVAYNILLSFVTASATWDMVVVSRFENNAPRVTADSNQVVSLDCDGVVDSQRRRLPKRGA